MAFSLNVINDFPGYLLNIIFYICMYVCMYVYLYICMYVCMYFCMYMLDCCLIHIKFLNINYIYNII